MIPITMIAAVNQQRAIGLKNNLMYRIPEDMAFFRDCTTNGIVVMGRHTYESIGGPLNNRICIVVTTNPDSIAPHEKLGVTLFVVTDLRRALDMARAMAVLRQLPTVFVIGGSAIYSAAMVLADRLLLTEIQDNALGDSYFPPYPSDVWFEVSRSQLLQSEANPNAPPFQFVTYER